MCMPKMKWLVFFCSLIFPFCIPHWTNGALSCLCNLEDQVRYGTLGVRNANFDWPMAPHCSSILGFRITRQTNAQNGNDRVLNGTFNNVNLVAKRSSPSLSLAEYQCRNTVSKFFSRFLSHVLRECWRLPPNWLRWEVDLIHSSSFAKGMAKSKYIKDLCVGTDILVMLIYMRALRLGPQACRKIQVPMVRPPFNVLPKSSIA